jgi:cysteine-rich repeat protein
MKLSLVSASSLLRVTAVGSAFAMIAASAACDGLGDLDLDFGSDDAGVLEAGSADTWKPPMDAGAEDAPEAKSLCGNRTIDKGEECDDGNASSGDGCSPTCKIESAGPNDVCGGVAVDLARESPASTLYKGHVTGTTSSLFNHYAASCGGGSGADAVYRINSPMTGRATARLTAAFSAVLSARTTCTNDQSEIACAGDGKNASDAGSSVAVSFPVYQGSPVFVFVDGYGGNGGDFTLDLDVETSVCGNGKAEYPEHCDDGNTTNGDGCSATCTLDDVTSKDKCPGMGYRMLSVGGAPVTMSFAGDTSEFTNGSGSATGCSNDDGTLNGGSGNNALYAITPNVTGNLSLNLLANYPTALLHVRTECNGTSNAAQADCSGMAAALVPVKASIPVTAEQTVYVYVDSGSSSAKGLYTLDATLTPAACGNTLLDSGEECDDGNTTDGDGCSATCKVERNPASYTCPGQALRLESATQGPRTVSVRGTTAPTSGSTLPANKWKSCGADNVPDVVYKVTSDIDGMAVARVKGVFNTTLAVRTTCDSTTDLKCQKSSGGSGEEVLTFPITKETPYFLVVDGTAVGQQGGFKLDVTVTPSVCGNWIIEGGETCDDGEASSGDGCSATCQLEPPSPYDRCETAPLVTLEPRANGAYGTTIVSGNTNMVKESTAVHSMSPCSSLFADGWYPFTPPISGVVTARVASATFRSTIAVRTACAPSGSQMMCDGTDAKGGQEITFAANVGTTYWIGIAGGVGKNGTSIPEIGRFTLDINLVPTGCGDTFTNPPEQCDDGNTVNGDGCSSTCALETLAGVQTCPGHTVALTGTGSAARRATVTLDTTGLPSNTSGVCGGSGPEGIFVITPDIDGTLSVKATSSYSGSIYARTVCGDPVTELPKSCTASGALTNINASVTKNTPYYIYVDGMNGAAGLTKLQITVTP